MEFPPLPLDERTIVTRERLRLLSLGYKISGAFGAIMVSFLIIHFVIFSTISFLPASTFNPPAKPSAPQHQDGSETIQPGTHVASGPQAFPFILFRIFAAVIGFVILCGWTLGGLTIYAGHCLAHRKHRTFIQVMAAVNCLWIPYGTLLGIATFVVLSTREAEAEFPTMLPPPL